MPLYDGFEDEETRRQQRQYQDDYDASNQVHAGANTGSGPWAPGYDPGPNWNDGNKPTEDSTWNMGSNQWDQPQADSTGTGGVTTPLPLYTQPAPAPTGGGGGGQPAFQPPAPQMAAPQQAPPPSVSKPPITDEVTKILMARLNELKNPGDLQNDPNYQNAVRAYQVQSLRGADRQRKALAERSAAGGTRASGGFNVGVRGIMERQGENAAQYTSGLALDRLQQREAQLVEAIRTARAVGQDDIANQLEVQRLQLQQELGRGDLALRGELGRGQLGLGYDQLGLSYADLVMRANRDAAYAAL